MVRGEMLRWLGMLGRVRRMSVWSDVLVAWGGINGGVRSCHFVRKWGV